MRGKIEVFSEGGTKHRSFGEGGTKHRSLVRVELSTGLW